MVIDLNIKSKVNRLFSEMDRSLGETVENPVTGAKWEKGVNAEKPQKEDAYRALVAVKRFADEGPPDAPPLPTTRGAREALKQGGLSHLVAWFAESLERMNYDMDAHPSFDEYARGVMASPRAPDFIKQDQELKQRFPPKPLNHLGAGLVWCVR